MLIIKLFHISITQRMGKMEKLGNINKFTFALNSVCILSPATVLAEIDWRDMQPLRPVKLDGGQTYDNLTDELEMDQLSVVGLQGCRIYLMA